MKQMCSHSPWVAAALALLVTVGVPHDVPAQSEGDVEPIQEAPPEFKLTSTAFEYGKRIPIMYTGEGVDKSPPLAWIEPPEGTVSFALIVDDPDAPMGTWVHWVLYNIPAATRELAEAQPALERLGDGSLQGRNDFNKIGYNGPMPPPGKPHRYFFKLYALDTLLDLPPGRTKKDLETAMKEHILGEARLMGTYVRVM